MPRPYGPRVRPRISPHDAGLAALVLVVGLVGTARAALEQQALLGPLAYGLVGLACLSVIAWRWRPVWAFGVTSPAVAAYLLLGNPWGPILFASMITAYGMASRTTIRTALVAAGTVIVPAVTAFSVAWLVAPGWPPVERLAGWAIVWVGIATAVGVAVRARRLARSRVRVEQARRASSEERLRVAQDVHDVVGHRLAVIAMQSGVALHVLHQSPDKAEESLELIRSVSKQALEDLRAELAQLRGEHPVPRHE